MSSELPSHRDESNEQEPLLGRPGDASQEDGQFILWNLGLGTASIAQAGIWILAASVWAGIFESPLNLFSFHPTLNSAGLLLITQGILILQPTHTPRQKSLGATVHGAFNGIGTLALVAGLIIIEYNKGASGAHWESVHGILGITTYILIILQALVGFTQLYTPGLYGGVDNAKKVYKYHRMSGYVVLALGLATVCAATQTTYNKMSLGIRLWVVLVASVLVLVGLLPRVKLQKLGLKTE